MIQNRKAFCDGMMIYNTSNTGTVDILRLYPAAALANISLCPSRTGASVMKRTKRNYKRTF